MKEYYKKSITSILKEFSASAKGLSPIEVDKRIKQYGYNEIKSEKRDAQHYLSLG